MRALGRRDWLVAGAGALVLATGFLPWFQSKVRATSVGRSEVYSYAASAWQASIWWAAAIVACVAAAAAWLLLRTARGAVPAWAGFAMVALVAAALVTAGWRWWSIGPLDPAVGGYRLTVTFTAPRPERDVAASIGAIVRDRLFYYHDPDYERDIGWGVYAGVLSMALLLASLVFSGTEVRGWRWFSRRGKPG